jgi:cell shape-determining protein MreD
MIALTFYMFFGIATAYLLLYMLGDNIADLRQLALIVVSGIFLWPIVIASMLFTIYDARKQAAEEGEK